MNETKEQRTRALAICSQTRRAQPNYTTMATESQAVS
jgi:hypothetical protein